MRLVHAVTLSDLTPASFNHADRFSTFTRIGPSPIFLNTGGQPNSVAAAADGLQILNWGHLAIQAGIAARSMKNGEVLTCGYYIYPWTENSPLSGGTGIVCQVTSTKGTVNLLNYTELVPATDSGMASFIELALNSAGTQVSVYVNAVLVKTVGVTVDIDTLAIIFYRSNTDSRYMVIKDIYLGIFDPKVENVFMGRWSCEALKLEASEFKNVTAWDGVTDNVTEAPKTTTFSYAGSNQLLAVSVLCAIWSPFDYTVMAELSSGDVKFVQETTKLSVGQPAGIPTGQSETSVPVGSVAFDNTSKKMSVKLSLRE